MKSETIKEIESKIEALVEQESYWLSRLQIQGLGDKKRVVVTIDHPQFAKSVALVDCIQVSRAIDEELEKIMGEQAYDLEVTSAGEKRFLRNLEQRQCAVGSEVEVILMERKLIGEEMRKKIVGKLLQVNGQEVCVLDNNANKELTFSLEESDTIFQIREFKI